jgi:hypothetical protein
MSNTSPPRPLPFRVDSVWPWRAYDANGNEAFFLSGPHVVSVPMCAFLVEAANTSDRFGPAMESFAIEFFRQILNVATHAPTETREQLATRLLGVQLTAASAIAGLRGPDAVPDEGSIDEKHIKRF